MSVWGVWILGMDWQSCSNTKKKSNNLMAVLFNSLWCTLQEMVNVVLESSTLDIWSVQDWKMCIKVLTIWQLQIFSADNIRQNCSQAIHIKLVKNWSINLPISLQSISLNAVHPHKAQNIQILVHHQILNLHLLIYTWLAIQNFSPTH